MDQVKSNKFINSEMEEEEVEAIDVDENSWNDKEEYSKNTNELENSVDSEEVKYGVDIQEKDKESAEEDIERQELSENFRESESVEINSEDEIECLEEENFNSSTPSLSKSSERQRQGNYQIGESHDENMSFENAKAVPWLNTNKTQGKEGRTFGEEGYALSLEKASNNLSSENSVGEGSEKVLVGKIAPGIDGVDVNLPLTTENELSNKGDAQSVKRSPEPEKGGTTFSRDRGYHVNEEKSEGRELLEKFEQKEAISHKRIPIILNVTDTEFLLVPFKSSEESGMDVSHLVTLYDSYDIIDSSVESLFCAIRSNIDLSELVSLDSTNELVLVIPALNNLYITEDNVYTHEILIRDFLNSFLFLRKNSELLGEELPFISLTLHLKTKDRFITKFNELTRTIREGKGFGALLTSSTLPDPYYQEPESVSPSKLKRALSSGAEEESIKKLKTDI